MAKKASTQIDLIDLTDGYSVFLSNDNFTFQGTTNSVSGTQTFTIEVSALCGSEQVVCSVGTISTPTGLSAVSDGKTPKPTITVTATSALMTSGSFTIPVLIGDITIGKVVSYSIAYKGTNGTSVTVSSTAVTYQKSSSGTVAPTGTWSGSLPATSAGEYLWTKTVVIYSDGRSTTAYSVSRNAINGANGSNGSNGTSVTVSSTAITYQASNSGTTPPTGTWSTTPVAGSAGQYVWTKTVVNYSDGKSTTSYAISRNGANGTNGKDALTIVVISSGGTIFKNTEIATTMTAHVYKGATELTGSALTAEGTIKWYKDGATTATATGTTLNISAGDITNRGSYIVNLED
ncbi:MAG: hypothetical protein PHW34_13300 [Hespellia sp.]|nr:hypothetical protein [Hespellia sp.]